MIKELFEKIDEKKAYWKKRLDVASDLWNEDKIKISEWNVVFNKHFFWDDTAGGVLIGVTTVTFVVALIIGFIHPIIFLIAGIVCWSDIKYILSLLKDAHKDYLEKISVEKKKQKEVLDKINKIISEREND